jgi:hypothetical protein
MVRISRNSRGLYWGKSYWEYLCVEFPQADLFRPLAEFARLTQDATAVAIPAGIGLQILNIFHSEDDQIQYLLYWQLI